MSEGYKGLLVGILGMIWWIIMIIWLIPWINKV
jgi:hypothetical protein